MTTQLCCALSIGILSLLPVAVVAQAQTAPATETGGPGNFDAEYSAGQTAFAAANYKEAEKQLRGALRSSRQFAANDPRVLNTLKDLSQVYRAQSKYADAEPLMERYLALRERSLGKFHSDLAKDIEE